MSKKDVSKEKVIKDAQYRKGLSIAFFNATNSAIALCQGMEPNEETLKKVAEIRDWFLDEHQTYYAEVIARVGVSFNPDDTKKRLEKAKNVEELRSMWLSLSQDERQDEVIINYAKELKQKYETIR